MPRLRISRADIIAVVCAVIDPTTAEGSTRRSAAAELSIEHARDGWLMDQTLSYSIQQSI
jgi:hypothetical protein